MTRHTGRRWSAAVMAAVWTGALLAGSLGAAAGGDPSLRVSVDSIKSGGAIPGKFAFCIPAKQGHVTLGPNTNPAIRWSKGPAGTASYAIIVYDPDVPTVATDVNKEGRTIPATLKRTAFYHWILVDIPPTVTGVPQGADSRGITAHGKPVGPTKYGVRGVNDYTGWFAGNADMAGTYGGYDGPCPPWNDAIVHHYHFVVYALNVRHLKVSGTLTGPRTLQAMRGHVLARGEVVGRYALNPAVAKHL
jgi:Raf kinase inhibitor-like YbhB/YbcL family protein